MRSIKLYIEALYGTKISRITYLNIGFMIMFSLLISNHNESNHIQMQNTEAFMIDYLYQGVLFVKLNMIVVTIVLVQQTRYIKDILMFHSIQSNRSSVMMRYMFSSIVIQLILCTIFFFIYMTVGYFLTVYFTYQGILFLYLRLLLYSVSVYLIILLIYLYNESIYASLGVLIFYLFQTVLFGIQVEMSEMSNILKFISFYVSDLVFLQDLTYSFIYGDLHQLSIIVMLVVLVIRRYSKIDLN